ncbi:3-hydroxyacyl-ACP dehydratase FabZ [Phreatobacter oligotrophus]|jgi:3-hydroxyacyl-[acyl-carrier-protein] dehydratase|uniref:3-hydroxyacyl-[acyl-carrier-protein] dehydratase FabZ n=1 Tax=Phreatobacter oligotrophus TaxID=1122261 RepID=A0A2T4Z5E0_9HYPH|nr:3-hydroxyacyl-ACP dehydratase FabZ [Phreatobacter oligotrophus]MBX9989852.1 3-hydroxyacyl-ACP dehydratase FabZ [Phreatobacter oligotrophus]PTM57090.1 3-hydroxyacyl-[acyl-carrier-protein] dehydratase [Phreatobacter oligotrophus]
MTETTTSIDTAGIREILSVLPHRYPFLLIDKIVNIRGDEFGIGIKNVTANEPQFMGHFPGNPIMPGVLMIEGMAQTGGVMALTSVGGTGKLVFFMTIDKAKFRKPVTPGDRIEYHMTKIAKKRNIWFYRGEAMVDGKLVAEAELSAMLADAA